MRRGKPWSMMLMAFELRKRWDPVVVSEPRQKRRCQAIQDFRHGKIIAQIWDQVSVDGVRFRTFTISRYAETETGPRTSRDMSLDDLRHCRKALRSLKKWRRDEKRRHRREVLRRLFGC